MMLSRDLDGAMPLGAFFEGDGFLATIDRFAAAQGGADRRAAASFWSLYYFSALAIPYIVARRAETALPVDLDAMTVALADDGLPRAFGLPHDGDWSESGNLLTVVTPLVERHLARVVALMKARAGISAKLAWNNAAVYIDYAFNATESAAQPGGGFWPSRDLFECPKLADGSHNPFHGCLRHDVEDGETLCRRKVCCLRYMLPGIPSCGELCALPEQRKQ
ncbi:siderophore-iron reductase FhuF [Rhizobium sp. TRM95111]|uniref:siderophore-iron reductase FhuF n=1 Tax=Rhizobium alarense TaxID=2846851 RepID=UPI001F1AC6AB|nr:siderophore-iron reductase FhuF [Rhizobium alarense]MCF3642790.1 siderophore-iron reductase FhuF [Rhizobium alarense]